MRLRFLFILIPALLMVTPGCSSVDMDRTGVIRMAEGVYALVSGGESFEENLGSNTGFVIGSDAVLVVDSGYTPEHAARLLREIRKVTDLPVKYLVNTHYHPVNVWGNSVFSEEGAVILARPETAENMKASFPGYMQYYKNSNPGRYRKLKGIQLALPDSFMSGKRMEIDLGGREVVLEYFGPAHTAGDCLVYVPECEILFSGGVVSNGYHPNMGDPGADFKNWIETLNELAGDEISYIVPGEGRVCGKDRIPLEKDYIESMLEVCADSIRKGVPVSRLISTLRPATVIPEAKMYRHRTIFPYNVRAVFLELLPDMVHPDFKMDFPRGFRIGGGGGGDRVGRMHWVREGEIYQEIEVQWQPSSRETILSQDVYSRAYAFNSSSGRREMKIEGDRKINLGGEQRPAVYGRWADSIVNVGGRGYWTLSMTVRGGKLYTVNCLVQAGRDEQLARERLAGLESVLSSFTLKDE